MVDFRYHLVSIIAVFLALALGIVIGTTALNGEVLDNLRGSIGTLTADKRTLEGTVSTLRSQTASNDQLADRVGPSAVQGLLPGQSVVVVLAPNASESAAAALLPLLQAAGATVTATVQLRGDLLDPGRSAAVDQVVRRAAPAGLDLSSADPVTRAATELSAALVTGGTPGDALDDRQARTVLEAFREANLLEAPAELTARADLAVVVAGDPVSASDPEVSVARARALLSYAVALDSASDGAVVAGPLTATEDGGALRALRQDGALSERVSSVDGFDHPTGRLATVYALREQEDGGSGRYGSGPGSDDAVPSLPRS